jgi:hypothetical protein
MARCIPRSREPINPRRRVPVHVLSVHVCAGRHERPGCFRVAVPRCEMQRCAPASSSRVPSREVTAAERNRSLPVPDIVLGVQVGANRHQHFRGLRVAEKTRKL